MKNASFLISRTHLHTCIRHGSSCPAIAINGFGRIGKNLLRLASSKDINVVAINQPFVNIKQIANSLKYDTVHGAFDGQVDVKENCIVVNGKSIKVFHEDKPENIKWKDASVNYVLESSGVFTKFEDAKKHIVAGAKKVIITAPSPDSPTFVKGVNFDEYKNTMEVVSNASCTTNCAAPIAKILHNKFGIESGLLTTIHSMTATQAVHDGLTKRSGPFNILSSTTGAAKAVALVLPDLKEKINGDAARVPTLDVSLLKLFVNVKQTVSIDDVKREIQTQAQSCMKDVVYYHEDKCVSSDFIGTQYSAVVDFNQIIIIDKFISIGAWYDNEVGYACRVLDLVKHMIKEDSKCS
ncbi:uncharacterized protein LOC126898067 [Daktulosphaira vitifoliae]|uniref:uncharacterized protein LOC126898067 n=1 Tax=Daktulosphaira vitifoliae TaxID=58002 RepID=UPI0021AA31B9|nr:uncharacterized protein LOC126898067 [Daktulosphaira vitifoliae]